MKNLMLGLFVAISVLATNNTFAQSDTNLPATNVLTDTTFIVNGVCNMCKFTIESAAQLEGVESAEWNAQTKILALSYFPQAISIDTINTSINKSGYDTEFTAAADEDYAKVHKCCRYRDPEVQAEHKQ